MKFFTLGAIFLLLGVAVSSNEDESSQSKRDPKTFFLPALGAGLLGGGRNDQCKCDFQFQTLRNTINVLEARLDSLEIIIPSLAPRCPRLALNARRVQDRCYSVVTAPMLNFLDAQEACAAQGGILAEPPLTVAAYQAWFGTLINVFPGVLTANAYVGVLETGVGTDAFQYVSGGFSILSTDAVFGTPLADAGNTEVGITQIPPGLFLDTGLGATLRPYICEFNIV